MHNGGAPTSETMYCTDVRISEVINFMNNYLSQHSKFLNGFDFICLLCEGENDVHLYTCVQR